MGRKLLYFPLSALLCLFLYASGAAQEIAGPIGVSAGGGVEIIEGELWYRITVQPELSLGKFGIGLDIDLRVNNKGQIRKEDWDDPKKFARVIRYIRYGHKGDRPVYARVGALYYATLGHGTIMNRYTNRLDFNDRKIGLELDLGSHALGFESVVNDLMNPYLVGGRIYWRPLRPFLRIPILRNIEVGGSSVSDFGENGALVWGLDIGLPILELPSIRSILYADYAKMNEHGSGKSAGFMTSIGGATAKIEYRVIEPDFLMPYFDRFYETVRDTKLGSLPQESKRGWYGEVLYEIFGRMRVLGAYEDYEGMSPTARMELSAPKLLDKITINASYDKRNVESPWKIFSLDEDTLINARIGYTVLPHTRIVVDFQQTFQKGADGKYTPLKSISTTVEFFI
jgi:hypothetical protein